MPTQPSRELETFPNPNRDRDYEISFEAPDRIRDSVMIDDAYVDRMLADIVKNEDLSRYIL